EDECGIFPSVCGAHTQCVNTRGSYYCSCDVGFKESFPCEDINKCPENEFSGSGDTEFQTSTGSEAECEEMDCDQFKPESDADHTPEKLKHLMSLLKNSCESLIDPRGEHFTGEKLLENFCSSTDELLSEGNIADSETLNQFLDAVENSMRLIGPQLKEPVTRMETHNTCEKQHTLQFRHRHTVVFTCSTFSKLFFSLLQERAESEGVVYSCVYWNEAEGAWSEKGCEGTWSNSTHTVCYWSHFSSFAVLMALYSVQNAFELVLIMRVGLVLSLVCLFLCILTFKFCRSIQGTRNSIHLHLSICLFIADLIFLCGISSTHNESKMTTVALQ
ncbi:hypothetical protein cypCar_00045985, partial [Cyprinus carpio]